MAEGQTALPRPVEAQQIPFWHDPTKRAIVYQALALIFVLAMGYYLFAITQANLRRQSIATGFSFVTREAGFEIGEALLPYSSADSYARALVVGFLNTLKVSLVGIVFTIILGTIVGVARLATNWLVSRIAAAYIEVFQNIPVLLQLYFWYSIFHDNLPTPRQSLNPFYGFFLNNRGFYFPLPVPDPAYVRMGIALTLACIIIYFVRRWARLRQDQTGQTFPVWSLAAGLIIGLPFIVWAVSGAPTGLDTPRLIGFNFEGGMSVSPEFAALLLGLVLYTSAFVAEVVRAGIQAISHGQTEAAMSVGLKPAHVLTLIILPQALRVIIPPLTSQMLNLTKNSSLAVAIGFPDLVSVANTTINQTGQAIEGVSIIMVVYLFISLVTSAYMNWYNKRKALVER